MRLLRPSNHYETCGVCHASHCKHTIRALAALHASCAVTEDESLEQTVDAELRHTAEILKREADPAQVASGKAANERFWTFITQRNRAEGVENTHSWKAKCEIAEATNERLVEERDALRACLDDLIAIEGPQPGNVAWFNRVKEALAKVRS